MSYGAQVYTDTGRLSLSSEHKHYKFIKKVDIPANSVWADMAKTDYSDAVLVAFVTNGRSRCAFSRVKFGIGIGANPPDGAGVYVFSDVPATIYIFDVPKNNEHLDQYGLAVYNASGDLIFDASGRYMQVLDTKVYTSLPYGQVPFVSDSGAPVDHTYSVPKIAVVPVSAHIDCRLSDSYDNGVEQEFEEWYGRSWYNVSGNKLTIQMDYGLSYMPGKRGFSGRAIRTGVCYCIVIDVTNY